MRYKIIEFRNFLFLMALGTVFINASFIIAMIVGEMPVYPEVIRSNKVTCLVTKNGLAILSAEYISIVPDKTAKTVILVNGHFTYQLERSIRPGHAVIIPLSDFKSKLISDKTLLPEQVRSVHISNGIFYYALLSGFHFNAPSDVKMRNILKRMFESGRVEVVGRSI